MIKFRADWNTPSVIIVDVDNEFTEKNVSYVVVNKRKFRKSEHYYSYFDNVPDAKTWIGHKLEAEIKVRENVINELRTKIVKIKRLNPEKARTLVKGEWSD